VSGTASPRAFVLCAVLAGAVTFVARGAPGLEPTALRMLFILVFSASLWVSEAIAPFAVGPLIIALEVALLGGNWAPYAATIGDPLIWLFLAGFVLAAGATRTGLDRAIARRILRWGGSAPHRVLAGVMGVTFLFSMFMSNTATTAMMLAVMLPILDGIDVDDRFGTGLLLGLVFAANIGGMATIIGTPPNGIAVGTLERFPGQSIDFLRWIVLGLPPALMLAGVAYAYISWRYPARRTAIEIESIVATDRPVEGRAGLIVAGTFLATLLIWLTEPLHGIKTTAVAFLPIAMFTVTGVLDSADVRRLPWDVLLLLAGGLSLGVGMQQTGLAHWLVAGLPLSPQAPLTAALVMCFATLVLSNFMSNTAAANVMVPIGVALLAGSEAQMAVPIALGASAAMCLPVSTPPNAIAYATGRLQVRDFVQGGLVMAVLAPPIAVAWTSLAIRLVLGK
jgi:sodium-dependent dicarboxylate transporter 2/3/5